MDKTVNPFLSFEIMDKIQFKPIFSELFSSGTLWVYEYNHHIVATCIVRRQKRRANHVASLSTLATHPKFQRQGIGSAFMHELFQQLKNDGIKRIDLCAESDNHIALNFYQKLGFQQEGILKGLMKTIMGMNI